MEGLVPLSALKKIKPFLYEIPREYRRDMRVPARVFANQAILDQIKTDRSLTQLVNTATLPGTVLSAIAMPDIHQGYGFPIGGVVATNLEEGVISPGGVGYDINCGVRVLLTPWKKEDVQPHLETILHEMFREIPSGFGRGYGKKLSRQEIDQILTHGAQQLIEWDFGRPEDIEAMESEGRMRAANAEVVSDRAKERGRDQVGSLGSGNHFLEIQTVEQIFNPELAEAWHLSKDQVIIMIHTGSRGLGHQNCTDYVRRMVHNLDRWKIDLPDRELACAPLTSPEGQEYLGAMAACANFAWANRQMITHRIRKVWKQIMGHEAEKMKILYDIAHNIAKIETHTIGGVEVKVCVHRKGATRAFPKNHPELLGQYRQTGQPVIIPGTMGTCSYVLVGTKISMEEAFGTVCHGAGRRMSRKAAKRQTSGSEVRSELREKGILVRCASNRGLAEEAPIAYKDVNEVVDVVEEAGLAQKVARMIPIGVIKGG